MRSRAIYTTLVFALIFFLSGPPLASAGASGETVEKVLRPESANVSSPPPATSAAQETSALRDAMPPKRLPLAPRSLGLRLVGTVVAEDQEMSLAIIEHEGAGKQRIYYEGARADKVLIKSILRNEVIIDAGRGDQRLIMLHGQAPGSERAPQQATRGQFVPQQQAPSSTRLSARYQNVRLARDEVAAALSDLNEVMKEVRFSPFTVYDQPAGIRVTNMAPGSILSKIGLRNGDVIKRIGEETIAGPEQATEFLSRLREGGDVTIWVMDKRRSRRIELEIQ